MVILEMDKPPEGEGFRVQASGFSYKVLVPETSKVGGSPSLKNALV
jgi:hypothetical protein